MTQKLVNASTAGLLSLLSLPVLAQEKMNVLFLMADDMRPELGCYGSNDIKTPNIDEFAESAVVFQNAYCNVPVSGASRASMLTGVYPKFPSRFTQAGSWASKDCKEAIPISQWFKEHGYYTVSLGKIFHHIQDHIDSWSEPPYRTFPVGYESYWAEYNRWNLWQNKASERSINPKTKRGPFCEWAEVPDTAYDDGKLALRAIDNLKRLKEKGKPFFFACGFWKPHLPFNAPKKYWDLYDRSKITMPDNRFRPEGLPKQVQSSTEILSYARTTQVDDFYFQQEARHGYYACVSFIDAQMGKIFNALEELGLADNTIVVVLGDHGWHLGEHNFLGKHNLMQHSTKVPLIVRVPGMDKGNSKSMVEFVDLYPTLCELCNLPQPGNQLDGDSFVPILKNRKAKTKDYVMIQWGNGTSAVDGRYNYAEWRNKDGLKAQMLFDHKIDPKENKNRAEESKNQKKIKEMAEWLKNKKEKVFNK